MRGRSLRVFLVASFAGHATVISLMPREAPSNARSIGRAPAEATDGAIEVATLPSWSQDASGRLRGLLEWGDAIAAARSPLEIQPPLGASTRTSAALDLDENGTGPGMSRASETRLADRDDGVAMSDRLPNHLTERQVQRIDTGDRRETWDDRRATPNPSWDELVATPTPEGAARIRSASTREPEIGDPSARTVAAAEPALVSRDGRIGADSEGSEDTPAQIAPQEAEAGVPGALEPEVQGHPDGSGSDGAQDPIASLQRPDVPQGHASVPAPVHDVRTRDNRTGRFFSHDFYRSYSDASSVSGRTDRGSGDGRHGSGRGESGLGAGARGAGADEAGPTWISFGTGDPRYLDYFQTMHRKIDPLWRDSFPERLQLVHEQGTVIVGFVLHRNGTVTGIRALRRSGHRAFDDNIVAAVRRAAPFLPIPREIEQDRLHVSAPFHFSNPMFR